VRISRILWAIFLGLLTAVGLQSILTYHPLASEDLPWTPLDLRAPIGLFTASKIARLARRPELCEGLLLQAGIRFNRVAPYKGAGDTCGWQRAVRLKSEPDRPRPGDTLNCPMAAGLDLWIRQVVRPAATELLNADIAHTETLGSFSCRRIAGRSTGPWSQHAFANAIDISGFRLSDGRHISVARDWQKGRNGQFLHKVRDGACQLFATTLSPDYNIAHRDHLHLDLTPRGGLGWQLCA
jgi:hypothetical protein